MAIPTRTQCLMLMEQTRMPRHIQKHSLLVGEIALYLARLLNENSLALNIELVESAALLHDIAKARSISTGEKHHELGAKMLQEWGYSPLAPIVREHVSIDPARAAGPVTESLIVNYADKRVKHDEIVTLEDRFDDLMDRYAKTLEHRARLQEKFRLFIRVEQRIFNHLTISPIALVHLSPAAKKRMEDYEGEQDHSGFIGRGKIRGA